MTVPLWKSLSFSVRPFNVCLWRLHGGVLNFIHLSATGVAEIAESANLKGCPHTFVCVFVYCILFCLPCLNWGPGSLTEKQCIIAGLAYIYIPLGQCDQHSLLLDMPTSSVLVFPQREMLCLSNPLSTHGLPLNHLIIHTQWLRIAKWSQRQPPSRQRFILKVLSLMCYTLGLHFQHTVILSGSLSKRVEHRHLGVP